MRHTLLELNDMNHANDLPKDLVFQQIMQKFLQFDVKDSGRQVRTVSSCLVREKMTRSV
ncbi:hypothetical protein KI688_006609 [Linnemannia hyalina]|uniref:Uncharacterized protein n=1 Tax=Linnemannia hyalina TaxID=64524 RepID=A0A9P8BQU8_9FUNG|nr:hypothetical protein KI688_006609 [Linnemannia hyalina]